jgi:hypothetical protein
VRVTVTGLRVNGSDEGRSLGLRRGCFAPPCGTVRRDSPFSGCLKTNSTAEDGRFVYDPMCPLNRSVVN